VRPVSTANNNQPIPDNPTDINMPDIPNHPFTSQLQKSVIFEVYIDSVDTRVLDAVKAVTNLRVDAP